MLRLVYQAAHRVLRRVGRLSSRKVSSKTNQKKRLQHPKNLRQQLPNKEQLHVLQILY